MNLGEIKTAVQRLFGDESGAQITEADIIRWANDAQVDIVRKTEVLQSHRETDVSSGDKSYELPSDFMFMSRATLDGIKLARTTIQEIDARSSSADNVADGTPSHFYTWGGRIYLYPGPSSGGTGNLDIWYVKSPVALVNDEDIPEIPVHMHEDMVRFCLARARELDADYDAAERSAMDYEARISQSRHELTTQPIDSFPAVRVVPGDEGYGW